MYMGDVQEIARCSMRCLQVLHALLEPAGSSSETEHVAASKAEGMVQDVW